MYVFPTSYLYKISGSSIFLYLGVLNGKHIDFVPSGSLDTIISQAFGYLLIAVLASSIFWSTDNTLTLIHAQNTLSNTPFGLLLILYLTLYESIFHSHCKALTTYFFC